MSVLKNVVYNQEHTFNDKFNDYKCIFIVMQKSEVEIVFAVFTVLYWRTLRAVFRGYELTAYVINSVEALVGKLLVHCCHQTHSSDAECCPSLQETIKKGKPNCCFMRTRTRGPFRSFSLSHVLFNRCFITDKTLTIYL